MKGEMSQPEIEPGLTETNGAVKNDIYDMEREGRESGRFEAVVEAVLFASGEPLTLERISQILERPVPEVKALLDRMVENTVKSNRGLLLRELDGKYQLCTRPELSFYVSKLFEIRQRHALSQAAYETLSIIAYNANVTRATIEKIRGVNSDSSIDKLLERNLIAETGRASLPGRPMRYDVTDEFYRQFGFKSRADLPDIGAVIAGADGDNAYYSQAPDDESDDDKPGQYGAGTEHETGLDGAGTEHDTGLDGVGTEHDTYLDGESAEYNKE